MGPASGGHQCRPTVTLLVTILCITGALALNGVFQCSENAPLATKYLVSFYESHRKVIGCTSKERTPEGWQVHAVRINDAPKHVLLTVEDNESNSKGLILLLDSKMPVSWRLALKGNSVQKKKSEYRIEVFATSTSELYSSNVEPFSTGTVEGVLDGINSSSPDNEFTGAIRAKYGALTTFSKTSGVNRISIRMSHALRSSLRHTCDHDADQGDDSGPSISSRDTPNAAVMAYHVTKEKTTGCFHPNKAGTSITDVHIIDLVSADSEGDSRVLPAVYFSVTPESQTEFYPLKRNITLFLKSQKPVNWFLESRGLAGQLRVVSNNGPVSEYKLAPGQVLVSDQVQLPDAFDQLWRTVIVQSDGVHPISYVKVKLANVLSMKVPLVSKRSITSTSNLSDNKARLLPDSEDQDLENPRKTIIIPGKALEEEMAKKQRDNVNLISQVEQSFSTVLTKECKQSGSIIAIPIKAADAFDVVGMTLADTRCSGKKNDTHWYLKTQSTSCGSLNSFSGSPKLSNSIHLQFQPGSRLNGLEVQIPFECNFRQSFFGLGNSEDDGNELVTSEIDGKEMYKLKISRNVDGNIKTVVAQKDEAGSVWVGDKISVVSEFGTKLPLLLSVEKCWISGHEQAKSKAINDNMWLIWNGCPPAHNINNVTLLPTASSSFTFDVTVEHLRMRKFYLFCVIGLCSANRLLAKGNIGMCEMPDQRCLPGAVHVYPAAQQLAMRGPINVKNAQQRPDNYNQFPDVVGDWEENLEGEKTWDASQAPPSLHSSHVVMVGVPAEIAVVIAIGSFVIGAALTGMLCCVLHRRKTPKMQRNGRAYGDNCDPSIEGSEFPMIVPPTATYQQGFVLNGGGATTA